VQPSVQQAFGLRRVLLLTLLRLVLLWDLSAALACSVDVVGIYWRLNVTERADSEDYLRPRSVQ